MAIEPTSTTAGVSLIVLSVALFGPMAGPYAVILFGALAGSMWPLYATSTSGHAAGAWLLLRCMMTSLCLTGFIAGVIDRKWGIPVNESLGAVALAIAAMGNGWQPVFGSIGSALTAVFDRGGKR